MGSAQKTPGLGLSQFEDDDKPTFRGDYNADMIKIDNDSTAKTAQLTTATTTANNALAAANAADGKATSAGNAAVAAQADVDALEPEVSALGTAVADTFRKSETYSRQQMLTSGWVRGNDGKTYRLVACALRNSGSGWAALDDSGHSPSEISSVNATSTRISLGFAPSVQKVVSLVVTPDETLAAEGIFAGASVGLASAEIEMHKNTGGILSDYVYYDVASSTWISANGVFTGISFAGGVLTVNHAECDGAAQGTGAVTTRGSGKILASAGLMDTTRTLVAYQSIVDGALATTPSANHGVVISRYQAKKATKQINPQGYSNSQGNLWVIGVFETAL